jgi:hypothetical protein
MKNKKLKTKKRIIMISKRNKKQKISKLKNRPQTREDSMRKGLAQLLMSYLETLNSKSCSLKSL